jgi:hypothetical protein
LQIFRLEQRLQRLQKRGPDADLEEYVRRVEERLEASERRREELLAERDDER